MSETTLVLVVKAIFGNLGQSTGLIKELDNSSRISQFSLVENQISVMKIK